MDEILSSLPSDVQDQELDGEESFSEIVQEFFSIVGGARLEDDVRVLKHTETGAIIARNESTDSVAQLSVSDSVTVSELDQSDFLEMRRDGVLEVVSTPTRSNVLHD